MALRKRRSGTGTAIAIGVGGAVALGGIAYFLLRHGGGGGGGGGGGPLTVSISVSNTSGNPLDGATVRLGSRTQVTDFTGAASFSGMSAGSYFVVISAANYNTLSETIAVTSSSTAFRSALVCGLDPSRCPCDTSFSVALCECSPLIPAVISVPALDAVQLMWQVRVGCGSGSILWGIVPGNPATCPGVDNLDTKPQSHSWSVTIMGKVLDSAGHPICNQSVQISGLPISTPFAIGGITGRLEYAYLPFATTSQDGSFTWIVSVTLNVTSAEGGLSGFCLNPTTPNGGGTFSLILPVQFGIWGSAFIRAQTNISVTAQICGDFFLLA